jgi:spore coat polysaccharide biosynthesis protein SpsF
MLAIIQARMTSARLPGKVLISIAGKPILERVYERVSQCKYLNKVIIATSEHSSDDQIEQFCYSRGFSCYRGPLDDVAGRFLSIVQSEGVEEFIRISGDSPLIDPAIIDLVIAEYNADFYDLVTNVLYRTFPKGQSVELVRSSSFKKMYECLMNLDDKEHVTKAFYSYKSNYKIKNIVAEPSAGDIQLSVDTQEDLDRATAIVNACDLQSAGWRDFVRLIPRVGI